MRACLRFIFVFLLLTSAIQLPCYSQSYVWARSLEGYGTSSVDNLEPGISPCRDIGIDSDSSLHDSNSFKIGSISFENIHDQDGIVYVKFDPSSKLYGLRFADSQIFQLVSPDQLNGMLEIDLDTLVRFEVADFFLKGDSLLLSGKRSELLLINLTNWSTKDFNVEGSFCDQVERTFAYYDFPLYMVNGWAYLHPSTFAYPNFMSDFEQQQEFFSLPVELKFDLSTGESSCFGEYPASYRQTENMFYQWPPFRARLGGCSYYCYPHVDSLFRYCDTAGTRKTVGSRSSLFNSELIEVDKSRFHDFSYLSDYSLQNDQITRIIPDPYRELLYVVCVPGIEPDSQIRFRLSDVAFAVMVFNSNLEFQHEVYFSPRNWNYQFNFVNPDGLYFQRLNQSKDSTLIYDGFNLIKKENLNSIAPGDVVSRESMPPLGRYLRDRLHVSTYIDTLVVISSLGCKGCLESKLEELDQTGFLMGYPIITDYRTSNSQAVQRIIENKNNVYIDQDNQITRYRIIGDFLTLIVLHGDSAVAVDRDFGF